MVTKSNKFIAMDNGVTGDYYVTWDKIIKRFYHLADEKEIDMMISKLNSIKLVKKYCESDNWIILLEKL